MVKARIFDALAYLDFDTKRFMIDFRDYCQRKNITLGAACMALGIDAATASRLRHDMIKSPNVTCLLRMCKWAKFDPFTYLGEYGTGETTAFKMGYQARINGVRRLCNPMELNEDERLEWYSGWEKADAAAIGKGV